MSFNPFKNTDTNTFETRSSPHAKTLRSTAWDKLKETFYIFFGNPNKGPGLFDYMTLGLPLLMFFFGVECFSYAPKHDFRILKNIFVVPLVIINILLLLARFLVSIAWTIIASPLVLLVNIVAKIMAKKDLNRIQKKITQYPNARFIIESQKQNNDSYSYTFHTLTSKEIDKGHSIGVKSEPFASITVSSSQSKTKKAVIHGEEKEIFQAFLRLNYCDVLTDLEAQNDVGLDENLKLLINTF